MSSHQRIYGHVSNPPQYALQLQKYLHFFHRQNSLPCSQDAQQFHPIIASSLRPKYQDLIIQSHLGADEIGWV